jgi:hypothetical protein
MSDHPYLTIGSVAACYGVPAWQIRRLFERGLLPPAARVGAYRVVAVTDLPEVEAALIEAGYLPRREAGPCRE